MSEIRRVLVACRGEIAVRAIRACKALGIESVAAVSEVDRESLPAKLADRSVCIGPSRADESYLKVGAVVAAALGTGSGAVYPGYGFLSERPQLPEACVQNGLTFIGPTAGNMIQMGDKVRARQIARELGVPVVSGTDLVRDYKEALASGEEIGYPVLPKAAAGGGGRGISLVNSPQDLKSKFEVASAEARAAFGDGGLYVERYVSNARHVEVQILGDRFGNVIHLGERDCSLQRRHQKILEEAPSIVLPPDLREQMCSAAVKLARHIGYQSAGTIEFLLDLDRKQFYFMEMNTRIQVEHPVTEMITGQDLVRHQIQIAAGEPLKLAQSDVVSKGHALECRINCESPDRGFFPSPGRISEWAPPNGTDVRVDTHCFTGYFVPPYYDSLLAKLIVKGSDRQEAIERMQDALAHFRVSGVDTTISFHRRLLEHPDFLNGKVNTVWIENSFLKGTPN